MTINTKTHLTTAKSAAETARVAKALGVNADWLRTGKGDANPKLPAKTPEGEARAIYRRLSPAARDAWMASGRALVSATSRNAPSSEQ